ncbi:serine/threonine-protein phosphatase 6 regulatory ankyrin repeat subunit B-like [Haliotis cracherodii]|uniref:serine/threonine-protein phosphatase 6 regulatory ankyrin repeat subunit B-like n=1 Tax=Haliotis cracherodii TaxID=6455 RepID=UPI0039EBF877
MPVFVNDDYLLFEAVKWGKRDKVRGLLSSGCHRNLRDDAGRTAVHWAAERDYLDVLYLLIDENWDLNTADAKQQTPLLIACNYRRENVASCLITMGCDVNAADIAGNTPLHRAVRMDIETIAAMLCKFGAEVDSKNGAWWTPLHEAARTGNERIVKMLLQRNADVNAVTKKGSTPFLTSIFYYKIAQKNTYTNLDNILKMFVDSRCRLSQSDGQWTPLSASISTDNSFIAALLIYSGCMFEKRNKYSRSLLVEAFTRCEPFVSRLMVMAGYQVNQEEVDMCSRRIPSFSRTFMRLVEPNTDISSGRYDLLNWLREHARTPKSLSELSRASIRHSLNLGADDTSILDSIYQLPLPECLKNFLAMSDFISGIL